MKKTNRSNGNHRTNAQVREDLSKVVASMKLHPSALEAHLNDARRGGVHDTSKRSKDRLAARGTKKGRASYDY